MRKTLEKLALLTALAMPASQAKAVLYDDFSSPVLDTNKWEVKQDTEGQPLMDEGYVTNGVFHTQQNSIGDRRTYLVPKHQFVAGENISYDVNIISKEGHYGNVNLLFGGGYNREAMGMVGFNNGPQPRDELGTTHIKLSFLENKFTIEELFSSGAIVTNQLSLSIPNANYTLYIGSFTGHNGRAHIDYDNFRINDIPEPASLVVLTATSISLFGRKRKEKQFSQ